MAVDVVSFKEAMARWATGVAVLTALAPEDGHPLGITVSSLTSLSIDPPEVLVSVSKKLYTHNVILATGHYAASILRADQTDLGMRFAGMIPEVEDRFAGVSTRMAVTGCPILADALAWVDCRVKQVFDGDDHTIFVGEVLAAGRADEGEPLLYFNRRWRALAEA